MEKSRVIFAIDIESRGRGCWQHGIISIGVCVGRADKEEVLAKTRFDMLPLSHQSMEPRCKREFWDKHPEQYKALTKNAKPAKEQIHAFRALLDKYDTDYDELYIVCDNPGFDFGMINFYLDLHDLLTLDYSIDGSYRCVHDADSYGRGLLQYKANQPWLDNTYLQAVTGAIHINLKDHNHLPENGAEVIYKLHRHVMDKGIQVVASQFMEK